MKKYIATVFSITAILILTSACRMPSESVVIEGNLQNIDALNGEMTVVTKDGEAITINITKDTRIDTENGVGSVVRVETDKSNIIIRKFEALRTGDSVPDSIRDSILPPLDSIEDVFQALGVGQKAADARGLGLSWSQIAWQLGYADEMRIQLQQLGQERLELAVKAGIITSEQSDGLFQDFDKQAEKWVKVILNGVDQKPAKDEQVNKP